MNEFTKEELEIIYLNLCVNDKTKHVLQKVGALIENYCEHEWGIFDPRYCIICKKEF